MGRRVRKRSPRTRFTVTVQLTTNRYGGEITEKYNKKIITIGYISTEQHYDSMMLRARIEREIAEMNPEFSNEMGGVVEVLDVKKVGS